jgi:hypothetical protein
MAKMKDDPRASALACLAEIERLTLKIHTEAERLVDGAEHGRDKWGCVGSLGRLVQVLREAAGEEG